MAEVVRQSFSYYPPGDPNNPRQDPTYVGKVANALIEHRGERTHIEAIVGGDPTVLYEAVCCLRRLGWLVEGDKGYPGGYTFWGWRRPARWMRLDTICAEYRRPIILRPKRHRELVPMAGQMEMGL